MVLVPGLSISGRYMLPLARLLEDEFRVVLPDPPGSGRSERPRRALSPREQAHVLLAFLESAGIRDAVLVGNSLSTMSLLHAARVAPHAIRGLVLIGTPLSPEARTTPRQLARFAWIGVQEPLRLWWIALTDYLRAGVVRTFQTLRRALHDRIEDIAPEVHVPVLLVRGSGDAVSPAEWNRELASLLPRGRMVEIAGGVHALNFDAPRRLARVVSVFVRGCERRAHAVSEPA